MNILVKMILLDLKMILIEFNKVNIRITNEKIALITGITGQDGSYLAEFLLKKGYVSS